MTQLEQSRPTERGAPDSRSTVRGKEFTNRFGLPTATALVVGSIIGTGVFALPSALAPYGLASLLAFVLVTAGALALSLVFGWLNKRVPGSGGPYLYTRDAFGDFGGFVTAWSYWLTAWVGNAGIAVACVGYVEVFVNKDHNPVCRRSAAGRDARLLRLRDGRTPGPDRSVARPQQQRMTGSPRVVRSLPGSTMYRFGAMTTTSSGNMTPVGRRSRARCGGSAGRSGVSANRAGWARDHDCLPWKPCTGQRRR
nr:amino acid permease [Kibdelosporangium sp. MJ126-NF4]CEL13296.1 Arginine/ornithine antiporter ArcD [Kibdelosporangium sp. MJ126-NF4]CTQ98987.1 Arginine/ornithine antiporter ArcD [Kibdelosporangium sp. MJ126-NF4]